MYISITVVDYDAADNDMISDNVDNDYIIPFILKRFQSLDYDINVDNYHVMMN